MAEQKTLASIWSENDEVLRNRYTEAHKAGMTHGEAMRFACSAADVGLLRKMIRKGCPTELLARIVL